MLGNNYEIKQAEFEKSSSRIGECPDTNHSEVAFIGRSNVGKSSLINLLTKRRKLAMISRKPGKTRLINHFLINEKWYLVDLPGYGWAQVSKTEVAKWEKMVHNYLLKREALRMVFVLVDIRHDPQPSDVKMINWLGENGLPVGIVFTKTDKISKNKVAASIKKFGQSLTKFWDQLPPTFKTSATKGEGREELLEYINKHCL